MQYIYIYHKMQCVYIYYKMQYVYITKCSIYIYHKMQYIYITKCSIYLPFIYRYSQTFSVHNVYMGTEFTPILLLRA